MRAHQLISILVLFTCACTLKALPVTDNHEEEVLFDEENLPSVETIYRQLQSNKCDPETRYLDSNNVCRLKRFRPVVLTKQDGKFSRKNFRVIVVSDIQLYVSTCRGNPLDQCIFNNGTMTNRRTLTTAVDLHRDCVVSLNNRFKNVAAVFDLGDLTDAIPSPYNLFAITNRQNINQIRNFHNAISRDIGLPGVIALGNHDYQIARDMNAVRSVQYLRERILLLSQKINIRSIDFRTTPVIEGELGLKLKFSKGSLSYSFEIEGIVFIILHWAFEDYTVDPPRLNFVQCATGNPFVRNIIGRDPLSGAHFHQVSITNATAWLLTQVASATLQEKKIVLMPHGSGGLLEYVEKYPLVKAVLSRASISAVINGHTHDAYGLEKYWDLNGKQIPIYYVGSSSYQKLSMFDFYPTRRTLNVTSITVYDSKGGSNCMSTTNTSTTTDGGDGGGFACNQPPATGPTGN